MFVGMQLAMAAIVAAPSLGKLWRIRRVAPTAAALLLAAFVLSVWLGD